MQDSKRDTCKVQTFGLCGRSQGWDDLREQQCEIDHQSRFDA